MEQKSKSNVFVFFKWAILGIFSFQTNITIFTAFLQPNIWKKSHDLKHPFTILYFRVEYLGPPVLIFFNQIASRFNNFFEQFITKFPPTLKNDKMD